MSIRLLATDRAEGKTTAAFAWVSNGVKVGGYPGWSRVLVLPTYDQFTYHRREYWPRLEDYDHRVYVIDDWATAMGANHTTEVCVDELGMLLGDRRLLRMPGRLVAATMTAWPWEHEEFKEWTQPVITTDDDPRWGDILS